ncbi:type II toxin-antitoxin system RelE/ParE family toxin, partial [Fangia hongkongensis]
MIKTFKHKGLKQLWEHGVSRGVQQKHVEKLLSILTALDNISNEQEILTLFYRLRPHQLHGKRNSWALDVNGNWRLTFELIDGDVYI